MLSPAVADTVADPVAATSGVSQAAISVVVNSAAAVHFPAGNPARPVAAAWLAAPSTAAQAACAFTTEGASSLDSEMIRAGPASCCSRPYSYRYPHCDETAIPF